MSSRKAILLVAALALGGAVYAIGAARAFSPTYGALIRGSQPAVYYYATDGRRYVFPNQKTYNTWYADFGGVQTVTDSDLATASIGKNVTHRAGTRLIKIPSISKVYAVEPGGRLRWVASEAIARTLWGDAWAKRVDDVSEAFFINYVTASDLTVFAYPTGSLVKSGYSADIWYIDGASKRKVSPAGMIGNRFRQEFVVTVAPAMESWLTGLIVGADITGVESQLSDTAQITTSVQTPSCPTGRTDCGGTCVDLRNDTANCGACWNVCGYGQTCASGVCSGAQTPSCSGGTTNCSGSCVNLQSDSSNCGGCGTVCSYGQTCQSGSCTLVCSGGTTKCGSSCVNTQTDSSNCGICGTVCSQGLTCQSGACTLVCGGGTTKCGGSCVNLQSDSSNCGGCGTVCSQGLTCQSGACTLVCGGGTTKCGGSCVNLQSDSSNCGSCGNPCAQGKTCQSGVCT